MQQQRIESIQSASALHTQQLQAVAAVAAAPAAAAVAPRETVVSRATWPDWCRCAAWQERLETMHKQHARWRASLEEALKTTSADVQLLQSQCRALESAIGAARADARRLVSEQESETQRQCE